MRTKTSVYIKILKDGYLSTPSAKGICLSQERERLFKGAIDKVELGKIQKEKPYLFHGAVLATIILKTHPISNTRETSREELIHLNNSCAIWCIEHCAKVEKCQIDSS